jgi:N4-(beta-N-acetylglucosaminyl)-L-asparaginase
MGIVDSFFIIFAISSVTFGWNMQVHRPCCAATWSFGSLAVKNAKNFLQNGASAVESVEKGINAVELDVADQYYVGVGGYPNANGVMELDAAIMNHDRQYGAVMSIPNIATPISVARTIMEKCQHNILTGTGALQWALQQQFKSEDILLENVKKEWEEWKRDNEPSPTNVDESHDTIGFICFDKQGRLAAGTSTSG